MSDFLKTLTPGSDVAVVDKTSGKSWPGRVLTVTERQVTVHLYLGATGTLCPCGDRFTLRTGRAVGRCFMDFVLAPPPHPLSVWLYQIWLGLEKASDKVPSAHNASAVLEAWRAYQKVICG